MNLWVLINSCHTFLTYFCILLSHFWKIMFLPWLSILTLCYCHCVVYNLCRLNTCIYIATECCKYVIKFSILQYYSSVHVKCVNICWMCKFLWWYKYSHLCEEIKIVSTIMIDPLDWIIYIWYWFEWRYMHVFN